MPLKPAASGPSATLPPPSTSTASSSTSSASQDTGATVNGYERTGITRHLDRFFDRNGDRMITLPETYAGVRDLGVGAVPASAVALAINVGLGLATKGGLFTVNLNNITSGMHAGDAGILDDKGAAKSAQIDAAFAKHAKTYPDALTKAEVKQFRKANNAADPATTTADRLGSKGEWELLFEVGAQKNADGVPVLTRARVDEFYFGDLFDKIAAEQADAQANRGLASRAYNAAFGKSGFTLELLASAITRD